MKDKIQGGISALTFLEIVNEPVMKIIGLVQDNQWFFGDPRLGEECMKIAADKLEELIKSAQHGVQRTGLTCPSCKSDNCFEAVICVNCGAHSAPHR